MPSKISFEKPRPVSAAEFATAIAPILTLTAPTGMTQDERKAWSMAAFQALGDVSPASLRYAVREAERTADHPAKIVPAIRKALASGYQPTATIEPPPLALPSAETPEQKAEREEVAKLMAGLAKKLSANA